MRAALQPYIVQVPPKARDLLLTNGHVRFVEGNAEQFAELMTESLYREEVGLVWENADYLALTTRSFEGAEWLTA